MEKTTFVRRHINVEAKQYTGENLLEMWEFIEGKPVDPNGEFYGEPWTEYAARIGGTSFTIYRENVPVEKITLEHMALCRIGDYVTKNGAGRFAVVAPEIFEAEFGSTVDITPDNPAAVNEYYRRHVSVKAVQFTGDNMRVVQSLINGRDPITHGNYAADKWEEYCTKVLKDGYMQIPSSLGYDPTYSKCFPSDYVVSPSPGVYNVMSKENFEAQYADIALARPWSREDILDTSGLEALRVGYGPIKFPATEGAIAVPWPMPGPKAVMSQPMFDQVVHELVIETERAIEQRDQFKETGVSTAGHGGSHDTCFAAVLRRYVEVDVSGKFGVDLAEFMQLSEGQRQALLVTAKFNRYKDSVVPEGEIPSEIIEGAVARIKSRKDFYPVGVNSPVSTQYQGIVSKDELASVMNEPGRFEGTSLLMGMNVNWHTLVENESRVFGTIGVCVGLRKVDETSVHIDIAFPQEQGECYLIVNNLHGSFMFPADEVDRKEVPENEILCCPPDDFERIRMLLNAAISRKERPPLKQVKNVVPLRGNEASGGDEHVRWPMAAVVRVLRDVGEHLTRHLGDIVDDHWYMFAVSLCRSNNEVRVQSSFEDTQSDCWTRTVMDRSKAGLLAFLNGEFPVNETDALKIATHRHYKGGLYYKLLDALHTETQEGMTVYLHVWPHAPGAYARPQLMFEGKNEADETRFTPLR